MIELPNQTFFEPADNFLEFFAQPQYRYRRFFDMGAGSGEMTYWLRQKGLEVVPVDLLPRQGARVKITIGDATRWNEYEFGDVCLLARPCHGEFASKTLLRALSGEATAFYIGLRKNLEQDLSDWGLYYREVLEDCGTDGENMYQVLGEVDQLRLAVNILRSDGASWWYLGDDGKLINENGGWNRISKSDKILETRQVCSLAEVQEPDLAEFLKPGYKTGWISPSGEFFPCGHAEHRWLAEKYFGVPIKRLEKAGFGHVREDMCSVYDKNYNWSGPNKAQLETLKTVNPEAYKAHI